MVGCTTSGRCTSTINAVFYGENAPATACFQRHAREWIQMWQTDTPAHDRPRQGWHDNLRRLAHMSPPGHMEFNHGANGVHHPVVPAAWMEPEAVRRVGRRTRRNLEIPE
eukprot:8412149-Pyramimonas_sp.AAC.1